MKSLVLVSGGHMSFSEAILIVHVRRLSLIVDSLVYSRRSNMVTIVGYQRGVRT